MTLPEAVASRFVEIDGFRTHYLEAGERGRPTLVLVHSCDYGSSAEISWERNIGFLARHFHVFAPDMPGYGLSAKYYDFELGHMPYRLRRLQRFLDTVGVAEADFIGNSCGASLLLHTAATAGAAWRAVLPIRRMVLVSPSIIGTRGPGRDVFDAYDGSREAMRALIRMMFVDGRWAADEDYVDRRHREGTRPGHWETVRASSLRMPGRAETQKNPPWTDCVAPVMVVNGDADRFLAEPDGGMDAVRGIASGRFHVIPRSGHCSQLEHPDIFHDLVMDFLTP